MTQAAGALGLFTGPAPTMSPLQGADAVALALAPERSTLACEGNVTEIPLFALNNKAVRARVPAGATSALAGEYTRRLVRPAQLEDGRAVERTVSVVANPAFGFPSDLGQRILHLLVARWEAQRCPDDPRAYLGRRDICRELGVQPCGREYARIEEQLRALKALVIECIDSWREPVEGGRRRAHAPGRRTITLIADWCFQPERLDLPSGEPNGAALRPPARNWIRLGDALHASLRGRYVVPLDWAYFLALDPVARRLYAYLNKKAGTDQVSYSERLEYLAERLPLAGDRPSQVARVLERALQRLMEPLEAKGARKRFLETYVWRNESQGWEQVVEVWVNGRSRAAALRERLRTDTCSAS